MELWIRSQDREVLMLINTITIASDELGVIIGYGIDKTMKVNLATYKTKERALEVLDEIQKLLTPKIIIKNIDNSVKIDNLVHIANPTYETIEQLNTYVYEMPKE